jgi:hypothetical protein
MALLSLFAPEARHFNFWTYAKPSGLEVDANQQRVRERLQLRAASDFRTRDAYNRGFCVVPPNPCQLLHVTFPFPSSTDSHSRRT